jgi:hypothetical protein
MDAVDHDDVGGARGWVSGCAPTGIHLCGRRGIVILTCGVYCQAYSFAIAIKGESTMDLPSLDVLLFLGACLNERGPS